MNKLYNIILLIIFLYLSGCRAYNDEDNENVHPEYSPEELKTLPVKELFFLHRHSLQKDKIDQYYSEEIGRRGKGAIEAALLLMPKKLTPRDYFGFTEILGYATPDYDFCEDKEFKQKWLGYIRNAYVRKSDLETYEGNIARLCDPSIPIIIK